MYFYLGERQVTEWWYFQCHVTLHSSVHQFRFYTNMLSDNLECNVFILMAVLPGERKQGQNPESSYNIIHFWIWTIICSSPCKGRIIDYDLQLLKEKASILNQPCANSPLTTVDPQRKLKLPSWTQTAPWSEWFKGGMLIQCRSIKLRKALCLVPKNNFPTLSMLSVLGGSRAGVCSHISLCLCTGWLWT